MSWPILYGWTDIHIDFRHVGHPPILDVFITPVVEHELSSCRRTDQSTTSAIRRLPGQSTTGWPVEGACPDRAGAPVIQNTPLRTIRTKWASYPDFSNNRLSIGKAGNDNPAWVPWIALRRSLCASLRQQGSAAYVHTQRSLYARVCNAFRKYTHVPVCKHFMLPFFYSAGTAVMFCAGTQMAHGVYPWKHATRSTSL